MKEAIILTIKDGYNIETNFSNLWDQLQSYPTQDVGVLSFQTLMKEAIVLIVLITKEGKLNKIPQQSEVNYGWKILSRI